MGNTGLGMLHVAKNIYAFKQCQMRAINKQNQKRLGLGRIGNGISINYAQLVAAGLSNSKFDIHFINFNWKLRTIKYQKSAQPSERDLVWFIIRFLTQMKYSWIIPELFVKFSQENPAMIRN